ncbi:hypothetical protein Scep_014963 [Stephania cephalantha]|uniref:Glutamine amidotransferase type-2 domain-containing protein n=1 Tax=Stephania cephalantha TaxID=152367 RepID=A0AAP0J207_9MAGN
MNDELNILKDSLYDCFDRFLSGGRLAVISFHTWRTDCKVNGEIYNHEALRKILSHHEFRTDSDCDVIAHLYEEYGEGFVDMLDGMFSFVLLDTGTISSLLLEMPLGLHLSYIG